MNIASPELTAMRPASVFWTALESHALLRLIASRLAVMAVNSACLTALARPVCLMPTAKRLIAMIAINAVQPE